MNYFLSSLIYALANGIITYVLSNMLSGLGSSSIALILNIILFVLFVIFAFGITVRRCHDVNYSGYLSLIMLIPLVGLIFSIYLLFAPGTAGENKYGAPNTDSLMTVAFNPGQSSSVNQEQGAEQNPAQNTDGNMGSNPGQSI